jgi:hypothetical protein
MGTIQRTKAHRRFSLLLAGTVLWIASGMAVWAGAAPKPANTLHQCTDLKVVNRGFGDMVQSHSPLAIDPLHERGRLVYVALSNGMELEIAEDTDEVTFLGNFAIDHPVEVCPKSGKSHPLFSITDRVTGTFADATLSRHPLPKL